MTSTLPLGENGRLVDKFVMEEQQSLSEYVESERAVALQARARWNDIFKLSLRSDFGFETRDIIHPNIDGQFVLATMALDAADVKDTDQRLWTMPDSAGRLKDNGLEKLHQLIVAKNKLWFDYWRVQNWAFLAGDRTNQPSSRDHLDPSKRWFPAEREEILPLIEAREKEIDALAEKLAGK